MIRRSSGSSPTRSPSSTTTASGGPWSASSRRIARAFSAVSCSTPWPASASTAPNCTTTRRRSPSMGPTPRRQGRHVAGGRPWPRRGGIPRTTAPICCSWCGSSRWRPTVRCRSPIDWSRATPRTRLPTSPPGTASVHSLVVTTSCTWRTASSPPGRTWSTSTKQAGAS